jgi:phosphopantothenoylcysteine decarboxylase / phosphopantothenate---cysteine ligase
MSLANRKIIVTGGPTREWIDPVRYISNASSGKMGVALADAAFEISSTTVFIHGPVDAAIIKDRPYRMVAIETTAELLAKVLAELDGASVLIMSAAPADYRPESRSETKIKKDGDELVLRLKKNPDILKNVARLRLEDPAYGNIFVVGFAAETTDPERYAVGKLREKNLDMICLNDVGRAGAGFGVDTNIVTVFTRDGEREELPLLSKQELARTLLQRIGKELLKKS